MVVNIFKKYNNFIKRPKNKRWFTRIN
jgi:hypothetical protein